MLPPTPLRPAPTSPSTRIYRVITSCRSATSSHHPPDDSYPETASSIADDISFFMDNFTAEETEDYSGVRDPDAFHSFQLAAAYCLTCSEDSSEGDYDPTWECFMAELADGQNDNAPGNDRNGGADAQANQPVVPVATPSSSSSSAARQALLAQLKELQVKLDE